MQTFYAVVSLYGSFPMRLPGETTSRLIHRDRIVVDIEAPDKAAARIQADGSLWPFRTLVEKVEVYDYAELCEQITDVTDMHIERGNQ